MSTSVGTIVFPANFRSLGEIPSGPVALEVFNLLIFSRTVRLEMTIEDVLVIDKTGGYPLSYLMLKANISIECHSSNLPIAAFCFGVFQQHFTKMASHFFKVSDMEVPSFRPV